jgi:hypothetical protein
VRQIRRSGPRSSWHSSSASQCKRCSIRTAGPPSASGPWSTRSGSADAHHQPTIQPWGANGITISFTDPTCTSERAGGKGANLGRLTAAGLPVPGGFVIPTDVYARFVDDGGIRAELFDKVAGLDHDDAAALESQTSAIRDLIVASDVPDDVRRDITAAYERLGTDRYVAVRSSGTAEDLAGASFAGLHDTYLDVRGSAEVLDAVKRCWRRCGRPGPRRTERATASTTPT